MTPNYSEYAKLPEAKTPPHRGWIILPTDPRKERWDLIILMCILYSAAVVPVRFCFAAEASPWSPWWIFEVALSLLFIVDMALTFLTALPGADGEWVTDRDAIARQYFSSWFWIDMPSSTPVELIELVCVALGAGDVSTLTVLRLLRLLRLFRLLRLIKVDTYIAGLEEAFEVNLRMLQLLTIIVKVFFVTHLLGCAWFLVGISSGSETQDSWLSTYDAGSTLDADTSVQYLHSVYYALTTLSTVGYGDIVPANDAERGYVIFALLISALLFGFLMGEIALLMSTLDRQKAIVDEWMDSIKEYMRWRGLPKDLSRRVRRYYDHYYTERPGFDEGAIIDGLNQSLRQEVVCEILRDSLGRLHLFAVKLTPSVQAALFPKLKPLSLRTGEVIFERGNVRVLPAHHNPATSQSYAISKLSHY